MDIQSGARVEMKKQHPCGGKIFLVLRVGMDFKIRCEKREKRDRSDGKNLPAHSTHTFPMLSARISGSISGIFCV